MFKLAGWLGRAWRTQSLTPDLDVALTEIKHLMDRADRLQADAMVAATRQDFDTAWECIGQARDALAAARWTIRHAGAWWM